MGYKNYQIYDASEWSFKVADRLFNRITEVIKQKKECSVLLTGGKTVVDIYRQISCFKRFNSLRNVHFYFGDERVGEVELRDTNFNLVMSSLFKNGIPKDCKVYPLNGYSINIDQIISKCNEIAPNEIDVMIFSMGEDGHIASIFPECLHIKNLDDFYIKTESQNHKFTRVSINPNKLSCGKNKYLLVSGKKKIELLKKVWFSNVALGLPFELLKHDELLIEDSKDNYFDNPSL